MSENTETAKHVTCGGSYMFVMMFALQAYDVTSNSVNILVCHVARENRMTMIVEIENG